MKDTSIIASICSAQWILTWVSIPKATMALSSLWRNAIVCSLNNTEQAANEVKRVSKELLAPVYLFIYDISLDSCGFLFSVSIFWNSFTLLIYFFDPVNFDLPEFTPQSYQLALQLPPYLYCKTRQRFWPCEFCKMSSTKRESSHIDNDDSNDNDQPQPTISSSSHTPANSPQNPIYISSTPPAESVMSTPASTGARPTETVTVTNDSGTGSGPGSSSPSDAPAKKGRGKKAAKGSKKGQSKNNENGEAGNDDGTTTKRPRKRRRKGEPEPDYTALMLQKKNNSGRCARACDRCHVSY